VDERTDYVIKMLNLEINNLKAMCQELRDEIRIVKEMLFESEEKNDNLCEIIDELLQNRKDEENNIKERKGEAFSVKKILRINK